MLKIEEPKMTLEYLFDAKAEPTPFLPFPPLIPSTHPLITQLLLQTRPRISITGIALADVNGQLRNLRNMCNSARRKADASNPKREGKGKENQSRSPAKSRISKAGRPAHTCVILEMGALGLPREKELFRGKGLNHPEWWRMIRNSFQSKPPSDMS